MTEDFDFIGEFLKPFTENSSGYIGFTVVNRSQEVDKNKVWGEFNNLYPKVSQGKVDLPESLLEERSDWEWYFTPAVLKSESRTQAKFKQSNVIWVDFDTYVDVESMDPAPSIVLESSPNKFHCYWIVEDPITDVDDMRYWCKRFLTHFSEGDLSGFDATQLLRLPWGKNLKLGAKKDGKAFSPHVIAWNPGLRYNVDDFSYLPEPEAPMPTYIETDIGETPETTQPWNRYFEEYEADLSDTLFRSIAVPEPNPEGVSGNLFSVVRTIHKTIPDPKKIFQLVYNSPVDKFSQEHGPRGRHLLWKDINRVIGKAEIEKKNRSSQEQLDEILDGKESFREKAKLVASVIIKDLSSQGEFVRSTENELFYIDRSKDVPNIIEVDTNLRGNLAHMLNRRYRVNAGADGTVIQGALHEIIYECMDQDPVKFYHFAHYDIERNLVYVDRYDNTMYILDGETIEHHPQGYDGIYFYNTEDGTHRQYTYDPNYTKGGVEALVLDGPNYSIQGKEVSIKQVHHILKTWISTFFFPEKMTTKPIFLIHGDPDSGKTTLFRNLSAMLTGDSSHLVTDMPTDIKEFNVLVSQNHFICLDNVNVNSKQMQEKLAQASTGYAAKNRTLHTNKGVTTLRSRAFIGMTSFTLEKIQKDVAQRYVILPVHPFLADDNYQRKSLSTILEEVTSKRDALWSEMLDYVNQIVKTIGMHGLQNTGSKLRMADYAAFLQLTADMVGLDYTSMEEFIKRMQSETMNENDPIFNALKALFNSGEDFNKMYTAKQLYETLSRYDRKLTRVYKDSRKFAAALKGFHAGDNFKYVGIGVDKKNYSKIIKYKVYPLEFASGFSDDDDDEEE